MDLLSVAVSRPMRDMNCRTGQSGYDSIVCSVQALQGSVLDAPQRVCYILPLGLGTRLGSQTLANLISHLLGGGVSLATIVWLLSIGCFEIWWAFATLQGRTLHFEARV